MVLFARAIVARTRVRVSDASSLLSLSGPVPSKTESGLLLSVTEQRLVLTHVREPPAAPVEYAFHFPSSSAATATSNIQPVGSSGIWSASAAEARVLCLLTLLRLADGIEKGEDRALSFPSPSSAALEVGSRFLLSEPSLRPVFMRAPLSFSRRTLADAVGDTSGLSDAGLIDHLWLTSKTALSVVPFHAPQGQAAPIPIRADASRLLVVLRNSDGNFAEFLRVEIVPGAACAVLFLAAPASVTHVSVNGEVIQGLLLQASVLLPFGGAGATEFEVHCGLFSVLVQLGERRPVVGGVEHPDEERFNDALAQHGLGRSLSASYATPFQVVHTLAHAASITAVSFANMLWHQAHAYHFKSPLLSEWERTQLAAKSDLAATLAHFWQSAVAWAPQLLQRDLFVVHDCATKCTLLRASDPPGTGVDASLFDALNALTSGPAFVAARYSPMHWDLLHSGARLQTQADVVGHEHDSASASIEEWLEV